MRALLSIMVGTATMLGAACRSGDTSVESPRSEVAVSPSTSGVQTVPMVSWSPPPSGVMFDYQLAGAYQPADGVGVVVRDWFDSVPLAGAYSVCYVNAYQTQPADGAVERPDQLGGWPADLVLRGLPDDPNWPGEHLIDVSTADRRRRAAVHVAAMLDACAEKGYQAVEFDNLDSWTRFDGLDIVVPFGRDEAVAYAALLVDAAHQRGLAAARKNTPQLDRTTSLDVVGFDFAIAEQCGAFDECGDYVDVFGNRVLDIEYTQAGFEAACASIGDHVPVILRDRDLKAPGSADHRYGSCR